MSDMSWSSALFWLSLFSSALCLFLGTRNRRRRNRRTGLPTPTSDATRAFPR